MQSHAVSRDREREFVYVCVCHRMHVNNPKSSRASTAINTIVVQFRVSPRAQGRAKLQASTYAFDVYIDPRQLLKSTCDLGAVG